MKHFVDGAEGPLPGWQGFQGHPTGQTLDKTMNGRKSQFICEWKPTPEAKPQ
jgi:hypothetical protein